MASRTREVLILVACISFASRATSATSASNGNARPTAKPPSSAQELWAEILTLLDAKNGTTTPERFEQIFHVRFPPPTRQDDTIVYRLRAGIDWRLAASLTLYDEHFRNIPGDDLDGAHVGWSIGWKLGDFPTGKARCLAAEQARNDLVSRGWTSPWEHWGMSEELARSLAAEQRPHSPELLPPPAVNNFFRRENYAIERRDRLPRGGLSSTGDLASSCVTGIWFKRKS